jgi:molecular chaperone GrpE
MKDLKVSNMAKKEKKQTKSKQNKIDPLVEMKDLLQRTQANFENFRKQTEKRIDDIRVMASRDMVTKILPVVDTFSLALKSVNKEEGNVDFINGVEMIYAQMNALLKDAGVEEINVENESFKPTHHEALMKVESDLPEGTIMEEFQKGFMIGDKVIRHARVKISAGKKQDSCKNEDDDKKEENSNEKLNKKTNKSNLEE